VQLAAGRARGAVSVTCTAPEAPPGSVLTLTARVGGRHLRGSPLALPYRPPLVFDAAAGEDRTISADGMTLTSTGGSGKFSGRTCALHTGPGVSLDIALRFDTGTPGFNSGGGDVVAVGGVDQLKPTVFNFSSNPGVAFLYNLNTGSVNTDHAAGPLYKVTTPNTVFRVVLHVRGTTLSFSAGPGDGPDAVTPQPGSWTIPADFYVLLGIYNPGATITLSLL
jgi:hypothetical protein